MSYNQTCELVTNFHEPPSDTCINDKVVYMLHIQFFSYIYISRYTASLPNDYHPQEKPMRSAMRSGIMTGVWRGSLPLSGCWEHHF